MNWLRKSLHREQKGFTLIELLVGLVIAGVITTGVGVATIQTLRTMESVVAGNQFVDSVQTQVENDRTTKPVAQWGYNSLFFNGTAMQNLPIVTASVDSLNQTAATINGNLTSFGSYSNATCFFQWGTGLIGSAFTGNTTAQTFTADGTQNPKLFTAALTNLTSNTNYHVRAVAQHITPNYTIYTFSGDLQFRTSASSPSVAPMATVSNVTSNSALFNGTLLRLGSGTTTISFEYGPTTAYGTSTPGQTASAVGPFNATVTGLNPGTVYHMRAKAVSGSDTACSNDVMFTTMAVSPSIYNYAIIALNGPISLTGTMYVVSTPASPPEGDIYANGNIGMTGTFQVDDVAYTGSFSKVGTINITKNPPTGHIDTALDFQLPDTASYYAQALAGDQQGPITLTGSQYLTLGPKVINGDINLTGNSFIVLNGTVWVNGKINLTGNNYIKGPGTIVATGNIQITGNAELQPSEIPLVISTNGKITVVGNSVTSAIVYAPNNSISLTGNGYIYGSVIGKSINNVGNVNVKYPTSLRSRGQ